MLATQPFAYKPGTLAAIANGYYDAGEPDKASATRRLALQEGFLRSFATSSAAAQQRLVERLPEGEDRAAGEAIQRRQAEAFAKDPFAAGIALYPDVGAPAPIRDLTDRIAQARTIAAHRGVPVAPFTAEESAILRRKLDEGTPQEREALLAQLNALPDDMKATLNDSSAGQPDTYEIDVEESMKRAGELEREAASTDQNWETCHAKCVAQTEGTWPSSDRPLRYRKCMRECLGPRASY